MSQKTAEPDDGPGTECHIRIGVDVFKVPHGLQHALGNVLTTAEAVFLHFAL